MTGQNSTLGAEKPCRSISLRIHTDTRAKASSIRNSCRRKAVDLCTFGALRQKRAASGVY
jgi:hypothetical protein